MRVRGKSLTFSPEEIEELADMKYGSRDLFGLLTLLFPFVDTRNQFHIDHVFPSCAHFYAGSNSLGLPEDEISRLTEYQGPPLEPSASRGARQSIEERSDAGGVDGGNV